MKKSKLQKPDLELRHHPLVKVIKAAKEVSSVICLHPDPFSGSKPRVFCICRIQSGDADVGCEECDEWYHRDCLGLSAQEEANLASWKCSFCSNEPDAEGNRQWTRPLPGPWPRRGKPVLTRNDADTPKALGLRPEDKHVRVRLESWDDIVRNCAEAGKNLNIKLDKFKKAAEKLMKEAGHHIGDTMAGGGVQLREVNDEVVEDLIANDILPDE